ncbi:hypothetical protein Tco_0217205 [Tanacetum coccineum]
MEIYLLGAKGLTSPEGKRLQDNGISNLQPLDTSHLLLVLPKDGILQRSNGTLALNGNIDQESTLAVGGKTGGFDQITNKDAIILYSLANGINIDYASIFWEDIIIKLNKGHREKVVPYTRFLSLLMMHKMKEGYGDGKNPRAKPRHKKHSTSLKQPSVSSKEETKGGSSKAPTSYKTGHSKKRKESSSAMDLNLSQPPVSTPVDTGMHKEDQQATGCPTSLGVISEERANPQLTSGMSSFNLNEPIYSTSFIIHSKSALRNDASAISTTEADPRKSAPSDFVPQQQGMNEGTKNTSYDHLFPGTDPHVEEDEASRRIKLEDLAKLVSRVFSNLRAYQPSSHSRVSNAHENNKAKAKADLLKAQPSFPNVGQLNELMLKDLSSKFNELTEEVKGLKKQVHELEIELPGDLKEIPSKLEDFTKTVTSLTSQVAELKTLHWELPAEFLSVPSQVEMVQAKLKTLETLLSLLNKDTNALNQFDQAIVSKKTRDTSVHSAGQDGTQTVEGEKNTNQATISQLFQRKPAKNAPDQTIIKTNITTYNTNYSPNHHNHYSNANSFPKSTKRLLST